MPRRKPNGTPIGLEKTESEVGYPLLRKIGGWGRVGISEVLGGQYAEGTSQRDAEFQRLGNAPRHFYLFQNSECLDGIAYCGSLWRGLESPFAVG